MTDLTQEPESATSATEVAPEVAPQEAAPSGFDLYKAQESLRLRQKFDAAMEAGDDAEASLYGGMQQRNAAMSSIKVMLQGGDPALSTAPEGMFASPEIEVARRMFHMEHWRRQIDQQVLQSPEWQDMQSWWKNDVEALYKERNQKDLDRYHPGMTQEEILEIQQRLTPVQVDPNMLGERRQTMVKLSKLMEEISGGTINAWNHPATARIATFMNRETAIGTPGYLRSGDQELPFVTEYGSQPFVAALQATTDPVAKLYGGALGLVGEALKGMSGGTIGWEAPTNFIEDENGRVMTNAGEIPGMVEWFVGMHAKAMDADVGEAIAGYNAAKEHAWARSSGFGQLLTGASTVAGTLLGYAPTAGAGVVVSSQIKGGLKYLGAVGKVAPGLQSTQRARVILKLLAPAGQASTFAIQEAISTGSPEKFLEGLGHGAKTGLVLSVLGSMGRGVEKLAARKNMPARVQKAFGLTTEAMGFTALEFADMQGGVWELIKDPSGATWDNFGSAFAKNWLGLLLGKGLGAQLGRGPSFENLAAVRSASMRVVGDTLRTLKAEGKAAPEALLKQLKKLGAKPEQVMELAEAAEKARQGDVDAAVRASELERTLEAQAVGVGRSEVERGAEELRAEGIDPGEIRGTTEIVGAGRGGEPIRAVEGRKPSFLKQMVQEGGTEGIVPERYKAEQRSEARRAVDRYIKEGTDPLEDPNFLTRKDLSESAKKEILAGTSREARLKAAAKELFTPEGAERRAGAGRRQRDIGPRGEGKLPEPKEPVQLPEVEYKGGRWFVEGVAEGARPPKRGFPSRVKAEEWLDRRAATSPHHGGAVRKRYRVREKSEAEMAKEEAESRAAPALGSIKAERALLEAPEVPGTPSTRRMDLISRMEGYEGDPIRTPQRKGHILGPKRLLGFYNRVKELIRVRGVDYELATRTHEFAHAAQEAAIGLGGKSLPPNAMAESADILSGYNVGRLKGDPDAIFAETWAEYFARDLLGEPGMDIQFPVLTKLFGPMLASRPAVLKQYTEVKDLYARYRNIGDYGRGLAFIMNLGDLPSKEQLAAIKAHEGGRFRRITRQASEWFFRDMEKGAWATKKWLEIAGVNEASLPINLHFVRTAEARRATEGPRMTEFVMGGVPLAGGGRGIPLRDAFKRIDSLEKRRALAVFLSAAKHLEMLKKGEQRRRAGDESARDLVVPFPKESLVRMMKKASDIIGGADIAARATRDIKGFFDDLIRWSADQGIMTKGEAEDLVESWGSYVPFQRYYAGALRSGLGVGGGLRRMKHGGTEEIGDVFEAMVQVGMGIIRRVHQHEAADALYEMGRKIDGIGGLVNEIPEASLPKEFRVSELLDAIEAQVHLRGDKQHEKELGLDLLREAVGEEAALSVLLFKPNFQAGRNRPIILHRAKDGRRVWLEVDKAAYEVLQMVDKPLPAVKAVASLERLAKVVKMPTELVRFFATGVNLEFAARNTFRDAALFPGYSKVSRSMLPWAGMYYWGRGIARMMQAKANPDSEIAKIAAMFRAVGGPGLTHFSREISKKQASEQMFAKEARNVPGSLTPRGMFVAGRDLLENTIGRLVDIGERSLRFEEFVEVYKQAREAGKPEEIAALEALEGAKEVTINFTRAGILSRQLNQLIPYFNASMQGQRKFFRAFTGMDGSRAAKVAWANLASTVGALTAFQYWWHKDDQWFKDLEEWQRFAYWHFKIGDQIMQIPTPHLAGWTAVSFFDQLLSQNKMDYKDILGELGDQMVMDHMTMPSFILPFAEWGLNRSFWRERPIVPDWMEQSRLGPDQHNAYTKGWAKHVSRWIYDGFGIEASPMKIENFLNQGLGGLPNRLNRLVGGIGTALNIEPLMNRDQTEVWDQIPLLSSFFRHYAHKGSRAVNEFYELKGELDRKAGSGVLTPTERADRTQAETLRGRLQAIRVLRDNETLTPDEAARLSYEVVIPFIRSR